MNFAQAIMENPAEARTENGMKAISGSGNALVDLFYKIGASRGKSIIAEFETAFQEDRDLAVKIALWTRDVRGGAGERELFRSILLHLERRHPEVLEQILPFVQEFGRWDDILIFESNKFKNLAYSMLGDALREGNGLAAKWSPRKGKVAEEIREFFGMSPRQYRKSLVALTNVVETKMCAQQWDQIEFGKLPSLASSRYSKAFARNAAEAYSAYKIRLSEGKDKVNAAAVYPYDIVKNLRAGGDSQVAQAQWDALPNYIGSASVIPLVDVSGSMYTPAGKNRNLTCLDVATSLGLYCADKNKGAFRDVFLTFSEKSKALVLKGNVGEKLDQMDASQWDMNTNLHSAFDEILRVAVQGKVSPEDMPQTLLILSDMQFDACVDHDDSAIQMIRRKYASQGYKVPNVVFWNLNSYDNVPVKCNEQGTALVSGFSPAIMKSVLGGSEMTPYGIMKATVDVPRYCVLN